MGPGDRGAASSASPMVSAIPAEAAPAIETTSPALALSSSTLPTPLRLKILVTLLSAPEEPAHADARHCIHIQTSWYRLFIHLWLLTSHDMTNADKRAEDMCMGFNCLYYMLLGRSVQKHNVWGAPGMMSNRIKHVQQHMLTVE